MVEGGARMRDWRSKVGNFLFLFIFKQLSGDGKIPKEHFL
jgi:hypothetical protein